MADDAPLPDPREPYGRLFHEQGRLTVNAEREKPFLVEPWEGRTLEEQELDMRGASAVAAQAVHDAGLRNDRIEALMVAYCNNRPVLREALREAIDTARHKQLMSEVRKYEAALTALGEQEEPDASR